MTSIAHPSSVTDHGWIDRALGRLSTVNAALAALIIVSMMLMVCADIASRNLFSVSINGVADYLAYAIVACVYLQLGLTIRNDRLVRATFLSYRIAARAPGAMLLLQTVFSLAAMTVMFLAVRHLWGDFLQAWVEAEFLGASSAYQIPTWLFKGIVAVASSFALAEILADLFRRYRDRTGAGMAQNAANVYGRMLSMSTIPMQTAGLIGQMDLTLIGFVMLYVLIVVALGMILDSVSIMLIILPIALPVMTALGGDPIWFGIITVIAIEIGLLTPPFGLSVYVVKASLPEGFASLGEIFSAAAPFVLVMALVTLLLIYMPWLTTALL